MAENLVDELENIAGDRFAIDLETGGVYGGEAEQFETMVAGEIEMGTLGQGIVPLLTASEEIIRPFTVT